MCYQGYTYVQRFEIFGDFMLSLLFRTWQCFVTKYISLSLYKALMQKREQH